MSQDIRTHGAGPGQSPRPAPSHEHPAQLTGPEAWAEALAQLQQQVRYNARTIEEQRVHLGELNAACHNMHADIGSLWHHFDATKDKIAARLEEYDRRPHASDVDFLLSQYQSVASKTQEIDGLKVQLELLTRRLRRVEGEAISASAELPHAHSQPDPRGHRYDSRLDERRVAHPQSVQQIEAVSRTEYAPAPEPRDLPAIRAAEPNGSTSWRPAAAPQAPATAHDHETPRPSAWASVNAAVPVKRPSSMDNTTPHDESAPTSPKRQKLAPLMPRTSVGDGSAAAHVEPEPSRATLKDPRAPAHHASHSATGTALRFVPYPPDVPHAVHESWRVDDAARQVGKVSRSSRGGRAHRVASADEKDLKAEQDRMEWSNSHNDISDNHVLHHSHPNAHPPQPPLTHPQPAYSVSPQETPLQRHSDGRAYSPPESQYTTAQPHDTPSPAAYQDGSLSGGKKSRTKPVRNADGILIRKDGRPDMRSISSAQNLRKVHAKKEAERNTSADRATVAVPGTTPPQQNQQGTSQQQQQQQQQQPHEDGRGMTYSASSSAGDSGVDSPTTPTDAGAGVTDKGRVVGGFASINGPAAAAATAAKEHRGLPVYRREGSSAPEEELAVTAGAVAASSRRPSDQSTPRSQPVMLDAAAASAQDAAPDNVPRVEATAVAASG